MKKKPLRNTCFSTFLFFVLLSCTPRQVQSESVTENTSVTTTTAPGKTEASILQYVNEHRQSMGLSALQFVDIANQQAYTHSRDMATNRTAFGHSGFDQRIATIKKSIGWIGASAENVAYGQLSAKEVVKGWLNSPGHKRNIEGDYRYTGIGYYKDREGVLYFTQIFFRK